MSELRTIYQSTVDQVEVLVVTPSASLPVDLAFMKNYMKVDIDNDDVLIDKLIRSAVESVERYISRSLIPKTVQAIFTGTESWKSLPILPVGEISEVKTVLQDGTETIHAAGNYQVSGGIEDKHVHAPTVMTLSGGRALDQVKITYKAGYAKSSIIPMPILETIWLMVTLSYQRRDLLASECITIESNTGLKQKLYPYKKMYL